MNKENLMPISLITQIGYCKRRAALIMNERQWNDNSDTLKGSAEHTNVHIPKTENRKILHTVYDMYVYSEKIGIHGYCDCIELTENENGYFMQPLCNNKVTVYPIEYKHGKLRSEEEYMLQLTAQAMCIEEMFGCKISSGAIFYISSHRRNECSIDDTLRKKIIQYASELKELSLYGNIPKAVSSPKCLKCSMKDLCMPDVSCDAAGYMKNIYKTFKEEST